MGGNLEQDSFVHVKMELIKVKGPLEKKSIQYIDLLYFLHA